MIALLTEPFGYEFMMRALATSLVASIVCALLSCWLVLVGWSLMGDAVSHAVPVSYTHLTLPTICSV